MSDWPEGWYRGSGGPRRGPARGPGRVPAAGRPGGPPGGPPRGWGGPSDYEPTQVMPPDQFEQPYEPYQPDEPGPRRRLKPRGPGRRVARIAGLVLLAILALLAALFIYIEVSLNQVDALGDYSGRPAATPGQDWLLIGSDSRSGLTPEERRELSTGHAEGQRTDTIMLMHIPDGGGGATLVSLPRDSYVEIPAYTDGDGDEHSAQQNKLNAAYAFGGPRLLVRTVEQATDIRIDHYMEIGFGGFAGMVDSLGGVEICLDQPIQDQKAGADLPAGCNRLDGTQALSYVRARYFDPRGDLGRVQRQQEFMRALTQEASRPGVLLNPFKSLPLTDASLEALTVDNGTGTIDLFFFAWHMRKLSGGDGLTTTVPVADPGYNPGGGVGSTVRWDDDGSEALFGALRRDEPVPDSAIPDTG